MFTTFLLRNDKYYCIQCKAFDITVKQHICDWCKLGFYPEHNYEETIDNTTVNEEDDSGIMQDFII